MSTTTQAVFQKLLAFDTAGGSLTASTFVSIGGENVTVATGGGAVKLSAFAGECIVLPFTSTSRGYLPTADAMRTLHCQTLLTSPFGAHHLTRWSLEHPRNIIFSSAVNALNVTSCTDVDASAGKCGTVNIAVLLLGLDPLSFEGISLPEGGAYADQYVYVDSGSANQKHSAIGAKSPAFARNITGIFTATSGRITLILQEALYLGNYLAEFILPLHFVRILLTCPPHIF